MPLAIKGKMMVYGGICTAIYAVLAIAAAFSSKVQWGFFGYTALFISGSVFTTIGVAVGDVLRRMAMPDLYLTKNFADSIKKRIFWAVGPQAIGWFLGFVATNGFMENYLGYDMKTGQSRAPKVVKMEQPLPAIAKPVDITALQKVPSESTAREAIEAQQPAALAQAFPIMEVGACVMGVNRQTARGVEFVRSIPVYRQGGSVEQIGTMQTFSAFYAEEQHSITGRVRLMYAPGPFEDEPRSGEIFGWVNAADLEVYEQRNCQ
jgi:hypothetical protein